jgi:hypothetical protein
MPNIDGTGPLGQGPVRGFFRGLGRRPSRAGRPINRRANDTKECVCPNCGHKEAQTRGIPCTERKCPECGTPLRGAYCA